MSLMHATLQPARTRLTLTYLAIIMSLSIGFSSVFYLQSTNEAKNNLKHQTLQLKDYLYFATPQSVQQIQDVQLSSFKRSLVKQLLALNAGMLLVGASVSHVLARRSLRPLEDTIAAQSRFSSDAAHELRTPLTAMKSEIEVALRVRDLTKSDAIEDLRSNLEEIDKIDKLTTALLRLAKSSETVDTSYWQDYAVTDVLSGAKDRLAHSSEVHNVRIVLPKTKAVVHGDPDQLVELFVILFGNAIKYSHEKSEVKVTVSVRDNKLRVNVADKGVGIAAQDLPHIFERFYRADQSRTESSIHGYGLGLSLADTIAKVHGGKIFVKSSLGKGTTFSVIIPCRL